MRALIDELLKVWRAGRPDPLPSGLQQLDSYLDRMGLDTGVLAIFGPGHHRAAWLGSAAIHTRPYLSGTARLLKPASCRARAASSTSDGTGSSSPIRPSFAYTSKRSASPASIDKILPTGMSPAQ